MRRVTIISISLVILGIAVYFILKLNDKKQFSEENANGIQAIPYNAIAILKIDNPLEKWKEFTDSRYGKNLQKIPDVAAFSSKMKWLKNVISKQDIFSSTLEEKTLYLSLHKTGVNTFGYLAVCEFDEADKQQLLKAFEKDLPHTSKKNRVYEEIEIVDFALKEAGQSLSVSFKNDLVLISSSPILMDESILQLKHRKSLHLQKNFSKLFKTADPNLDANLFINYQELNHLIQLFGNETYLSKTKTTQLGNWMEVDIKIGQDGLNMNGFSSVDDSTATFLSTFTGQQPSAINAASVLPENLAFLSYSGFSDFGKLLDNHKKYLQQKQMLFSYEKNCQDIESKNGINLKEGIYNWIGNEICFFITQGTQDNPFANAGYVIHSNDIELATTTLKQIQQRSGKGSPENYQEHLIGDLGIDNFIPNILGNTVFENMHTYYAIVNDYVIFAHDLNNLKTIVADHAAGRTLIKNQDFKQFYENFSNESSYFVYIHPKKAANFWNYFLSPVLAKIFTDHQKQLDVMEAFAFQVVANENLFFTNAYSNYKIVKQDKKVSLVECSLDTSYSLTPWIVSNHYTHEKEILIQDDNNTLYLLTNAGKILWKKQLKGRIIGEVHLIDKFKNNKIQYLFGTGSELQLIDRNGENVTGFPVALREKQNQGIGVADYENNKDYRIFVPCGKKLICFDKDGKQVTGFVSPNLSSKIACAPKYIFNEGKDYIVFCDEGGKLYALSRKGEARIAFKNGLPIRSKKYEVIQGEDLNSSGIVGSDSKGLVYFVKLNDSKIQLNSDTYGSTHGLNVLSLGAGDEQTILLYDRGNIGAYGLDKKVLFNIKSSGFNPTYGFQSYALSGGEKVIFATDKQQNKLYGYGVDGDLLSGFPMDAATPALVDDLNQDGSVNLIIGTSTGKLLIYSEF